MQAMERFANRLQRAIFNNRNFWNQRYTTDLEKGSGPGSRGDSLRFKREIIKSLVLEHKILSILDIGCGDIAILDDVDISSYVGLDISDVIIERNRALRPNWTFLCEDLTGPFVPPSAELVLCLDVLIHQRRRRDYLTLLEKALHSGSKVVLLSGYNRKDPGWNVFYYEPLVESVRRMSPGSQIERLGEYRSTDLIKVEVGSLVPL
jgi:SAM-dependent methyltransferase